METPLLSHLRSSDYDVVYEPAEDSFLMLDALEHDLALLHRLHPSFILEIGSGSGVTITALAKKFRNVACFATDINLKACEMTGLTAELNGTSVECVNMDLLLNFRGGIFDVVIFNPPYVVTESCEISGTGIERSWAGGINGREITDRLLAVVKEFLQPRGVFYLITIEENDPADVCEMMRENGFHADLVKERKIRGEHLKVWRFSFQM